MNLKKLIKPIVIIVVPALSFWCGFYLNSIINDKNLNEGPSYEQPKTEIKHKMENKQQINLGAFSMSLSVKDLKTSKEFYEKLGFSSFGGGMEQNYLIMKNGNALIGLFQGMFQGNIITFNPGWDENGKNLESFMDIREIQKHLKSNNISLTSETDEKTTGPGSLMVTDPDGNVILLDQHR